MQDDNIKVLYIAHYRENSGWARAAIDYILALDSVGVDVVCRNISVSNRFADVPERIIELEKKETQGVTHCIQNVLPHHYVGTDKYEKNIGCFFTETEEFQHTNWFEYLRLMDEIWCPNNDLDITLEYNGLKSVNIGIPTDISKYAQEYPIIDMGDVNHTFKFYTICDLNDRKNLESTITCFHAAFDPSDPVSLVIKVKRGGMTKEELGKYVGDMCDAIKKRMRLYKDPSKYNKEVIFSWDMTDDEIMSLHATCDCFVNTSHGEAWSIPTFDAMAMGNTPITPRYGGPVEFCTAKLSYLIDVNRAVCRCNDSPFPDLFTGRDYWTNPDEELVVEAMQKAYSLKNQDYTIDARKKAKEFSYESIGQKMKEQLCR